MKERIKQIRQHFKLSQSKFADSLGYKQNAVAQWETGQNAISDSVVKLISSIYNINEEWLRTGKGEMFVETLGSVIDEVTELYHLDPYQRAFIEEYLNAPPEQKKAFNDFLDSLLERQNEIKQQLDQNTVDFPAPMIEIPKVGDTAAGSPMEMIENLYSGEMITVPEQYRGCIALTVKGDSMEPKIPYGSLVYVRQQKVLDDGDIGIFYINNEITCKKYKIVNGVPELHSINPNYPPIKFEENDEALIMGRVVDWQIEE